MPAAAQGKLPPPATTTGLNVHDPMSDQVRSTIQKRDRKGVIRHGGEWLAIWSDPDSLKSEVERLDDRKKLELIEQYQRQLAASARSVARNAELEVRYGKGRSSSGRIVLEAFDPDNVNLAAARGACDAKASLLRFHDPRIHARFAPKDRVEGRLFDLLESLRCQGLACREFAGMARNLAARQYQRLGRAQLLNAHLASLLPLSEGLEMVLRDSFCKITDSSIQTAGMRMWHRWLDENFQSTIENLGSTLRDQRAYASLALHFLSALFKELPSKGQRVSKFANRREDEPSEQGEVDDPFLRETDVPEQITHFDPGEWFLDKDEDTVETALLSPDPDEPFPYRAYTTRFDRVVDASELADRAELRHLRHELDRKRQEYRQSFAKLVARLQRRLMAMQLRSWEFDLEEGLIDASKLDRIVLSPQFSNAYKVETQSPFRDTVVSLLIDNSGSMRGKPIEIAALVSDLLAAALERCLISTEVLGFTTSAWKGGKSALEWARAGRPPDPGRLNDLLHIVYKGADTPYRRARDNLCAMLSPAVLKENIDGESLVWAAKRLLKRPESRKLLVVISDGAPVDHATLEENSDKRLLDRHLREVVQSIEHESAIELSAIGIKHDVGSYYRRAIRINKVDDLGSTLVSMLDSLFLEN